MKTTTRQKLSIESVRIEHVIDENPDSSHIAEFHNRPKGYFVDRETGCLMDDETVLAADCHVSDYLGRGEYKLITGFQHDGNAANWAHVTDAGVHSAYLHIRYRANGDKSRRRMYVNLFKYFGVVGWETAQTRKAKIRCIETVYCCLDAQRLDSLNNNEWSFLGVIAKAVVRNPETGTCQTIRSGGLWGVESDAGEYLEEIGREQLGELRSELLALGIGPRAINHAFKTVETP